MKREIIKISIIDDDIAYKEFLKDLLSKEDIIRIYKEYSCAKDFVNDLSDPFQPDICLLDIKLPDMSGIDCAKIVLEKQPQMIVIIMTAYPDKDTLTESTEIGLHYFEKGTIGEKLIKNIIKSRDILEKERFMFFKKMENEEGSLLAIKNMLEDLQNKAGLLSKSEKKILRLVQDDKSKEEISSILSISIKTVQSHINNSEYKLGIKATDTLLKHINII